MTLSLLELLIAAKNSELILDCTVWFDMFINFAKNSDKMNVAKIPAFWHHANMAIFPTHRGLQVRSF